MGLDEAEFLRKLRKASLDTLVAHLSLLNEFKTGLREGDGADRDQAPGDLLFDLSNLVLSRYVRTMETGLIRVDEIANELRALGQRYALPYPRQTLEPRIRGNEACAGFSIVNTLSTKATVSFNTGDFERVDGDGQGLAVPVTIEGGRSLGPREERVFAMKFPVDGLERGQRYRFETFVMMQHQVACLLVIDVRRRQRRAT